MSEPIDSSEFKEHFSVLLKEIQSAWTNAQNVQSDILKKYGPVVNNEVVSEIPEKGKNALIPFLQSIPGVYVDEKTKTTALDTPNHIVITSYALNAFLAYNNHNQLIKTGIEFGNKPMVSFGRIIDGEGLSVQLQFDKKANLSKATITKTKNPDWQKQSSKGNIVLDNNGNIISSNGELKVINKGQVLLVQLLKNITNPQGLDTKIDYKTIIPFTKSE